jgi:glutathione-regulated potassium-efflux system ancillary protein KefF
MIALLFAHPHRSRSIAQRALLDAVRDLPLVAVRSLYDLYPDFSIDVAAERAALASARLVIWQHPLYWYSVPALFAHWYEVVLERGWAYGAGGTALRGKDCLWVTSTGASSDAYSTGGKHAHPFDAFEPHVRQVARFCGMNWLPPLVVHGSHVIGADALARHAAAYRARLLAYVEAANATARATTDAA